VYQGNQLYGKEAMCGNLVSIVTAQAQAIGQVGFLKDRQKIITLEFGLLSLIQFVYDTKLRLKQRGNPKSISPVAVAVEEYKENNRRGSRKQRE
jgi:hypothetical protein